MRLAAIQHDIKWENPEANFRSVSRLLEANPPPPESLLVLPEMFSTGYSMNVAKVAETEPSSAEAFMSQLALSHRCWIAGGLVGQDSDGKGRNELSVFGPDGQRVGKYQKNYSFSYAREDQSYRSGSELLVFPWHGFNVCPTICYDLRFPELYRRGVRAGANLFLVIANWPAARLTHWRALLQARAIENQSIVVGVNRVGSDPRVQYAGHSLIFNHRGEILAEAGEQECVVSAEADLASLNAWRAEFPALRDIKAP